MRTTDPATMTPTERLAEVAELLARGIQRFLATRCKALGEPKNSQVRLDVVARVEASCRPRVQSPQTTRATA